jgi:hypothetical protein
MSNRADNVAAASAISRHHLALPERRLESETVALSELLSWETS